MSSDTVEEAGARILSLDGGDVRCLSQLFILREYMHRIQVDLGETVRPCDHFHSITGVGASGVIAVFLGMLGMTVEQSIDAFGSLCKQVFPLGDITPQKRSSLLEDALKKILKSHGVLETARMRDASIADGRCKVSIGYLPSALIAEWRSFRNYESRQWSENPTVIDAVCAAWATPNLFASVIMSSVGSTKDLISAEVAFRNPTWQAIKEAVDAFSGERQISYILSLGSGILSIILSNEALELGHHKGETDAEELEHRLLSTNVYFRFSVDRGLEHGIDVNDKGFGSIEEYTTSYLRRVAVTRTLDSCVSASQKKSAFAIGDINHITCRPKPTVAGLPPLSPFFVERKEPMDRIRAALLGDPAEVQQRLCIVSGLGGSGKTQLAIKFARENSDRFQHVLFVDASSEDRAVAGLIKRLRAIDSNFKGTTRDDLLDALSEPSEQLTTNWCIIFDNMDNAQIHPSNFLPHCDHGTFLITTRNEKLLEVSDEQHIRLDVMSETEAVNTLLSAAFPNKVLSTQITPSHRETALRIAKELGLLPIAIVQAGCYIKHQKCLDDYLDRLKHSRQRVLTHHIRQVTALKYNHTAYDAFDTTLPILSSRARNFLAIMSFFHPTGFPRRLLSIALSRKFELDEFNFAERDAKFHDAIALLKNTFLPHGSWNEMDLDELLDELQQYSMVSLVSLHDETMFRFHPLLHAWAADRLTTDNHLTLRLAALRVICSGWEDGDANESICQHVDGFLPIDPELHINDRAVLTQIQKYSGENTVDSWTFIYEHLKKEYGKSDIRTSDAALHLADAYGNAGDADKMEEIEREQYKIRMATFGSESLEAMRAAVNLSGTLVGFTNKCSEGEELARMVLSVVKQSLQPPHKEILHALYRVASVLMKGNQHKEASIHLEEAVAMSALLFGHGHSYTTFTMEELAMCYTELHDERGEFISREILTLCRSKSKHATVRAIDLLADACADRGQLGEAEALRREQLEKMKEMYKGEHSNIVDSLFKLGFMAVKQKQYEKAEPLWREAMEMERSVHGDKCPDYAIAVSWYAISVFEQSRYGEAEKLWREALSVWRRLEDNQEICSTLSRLSWVAELQDRYDEAEVLIREHLTLVRELKGNNSSETMKVLGRLAKNISSQGRYVEAESLLSEHYTTTRELLGEDNEGTLNSLHQLALAIHNQERYEEAESLWKRELAARNSSPSPDSKALLDCLEWLTKSFEARGNQSEAETCLREAVEVSRKLYGTCHEKSLDFSQKLALSVLLQKRYKEAEELWTEQDTLEQKFYGESQGCVSLHWLGRAIFHQGRYMEAGDLFQKEYTWWKADGGYPRFLSKSMEWLARSLARQQQFDKAKSLWEETLVFIREKGDKTELIKALGSFSSFLGDERRFGEAEIAQREWVALARELWGSDYLSTLEALESLAWSIQMQERYVESGPLWEEVISISQELRGQNHILTIQAKGCLSLCKHCQKLYSEAESIRKNILEAEGVVWSNPLERLDHVHWRGVAVYRQGRYGEAESLWREELEERRGSGKENEWDHFVRCLHWMGASLFLQGRYHEAEPLWREEIEERQQRASESNDGSVKLLQAQDWLAQCLAEIGTYDEAKRLYEEVIEGWGSSGDKWKDKKAAAETNLQELVSKMQTREVEDPEPPTSMQEEASPRSQTSIRKDAPSDSSATAQKEEVLEPQTSMRGEVAPEPPSSTQEKVPMPELSSQPQTSTQGELAAEAPKSINDEVSC